MVIFTPWRDSSSRLACSRASPLRAARCRWHPSAANSSATARPMPLDAPVIRAVLFVSLSSTPFSRMQTRYTNSSNLHTKKLPGSFKAGEKVQKVVTEQVDVIAHGAVRPPRIMSEDRLHDRLVLADGVGDP